MKKKDKLAFIEKILEDNEVSTQDELTKLLKKSGLDLSQATVSRYVSELNLIKVEGKEKKFKYIKANSVVDISKKIIDLFKQVTLSYTAANNLIVIKTLSGNASSAGMAIDQMHFPQAIGTIAGDDTLLVITKSNQDADILVKSLRLL